MIEYMRLTFVPGVADVTEQSLNHWSEEGWRVVGYSFYDGVERVLMMREKPQ